MSTPTLSQLADIGAAAALNLLTSDQDDSDMLVVAPRNSAYEGDAPAREAFAKAVLDAVGYKLPVDPEREAFDAWVTTAGWDLRESPFEAWKAGRAARDKELEIRDARSEQKHAAEIAEPETFEAHGLTWFKHKPGDPMPCDGDTRVQVIWDDEVSDLGMRLVVQKAHACGWRTDARIVGWRYANADTP
jgi:hypothetical protein